MLVLRARSGPGLSRPSNVDEGGYGLGSALATDSGDWRSVCSWASAQRANRTSVQALEATFRLYRADWYGRVYMAGLGMHWNLLGVVGFYRRLLMRA